MATSWSEMWRRTKIGRYSSILDSAQSLSYSARTARSMAALSASPPNVRSKSVTIDLICVLCRGSHTWLRLQEPGKQIRLRV
jgi:hypothetical protein